MSMLSKQCDELREAAVICTLAEEPVTAKLLREAADTIEKLQTALNKAAGNWAKADSQLCESYEQVPEQGKRKDGGERESCATQECHATQANYEHCKYSTNRGWRDASRYAELFGTPERAARTLSKTFIACECEDTHCDACPLFDPITDDCNYTRDCVALLEWLKDELRGDAE